ncbi:MAG: sirohydrochlorin chelatase [Actinomycetota bacterium]
MTPDPVLVTCAHGTREPSGRAAVGRLIAAIRRTAPTVRVCTAFVDVQPPAPGRVLTHLAETTQPAVIVPLLLSTGYHIRVDIAEAITGRYAVSAPALGPDDRITDILLDRLRDNGLRPDDAIVVAAAGSSDPRAAQDVGAVCAAIAQDHQGPVSIGYAASAHPSVPDAVAAARPSGRRVVVASYLLAPGFFHRRLTSAGADVVTPALLAETPDQRLVEVVLDRYTKACELLEERVITSPCQPELAPEQA